MASVSPIVIDASMILNRDLSTSFVVEFEEAPSSRVEEPKGTRRRNLEEICFAYLVSLFEGTRQDRKLVFHSNQLKQAIALSI